MPSFCSRRVTRCRRSQTQTSAVWTSGNWRRSRNIYAAHRSRGWQSKTFPKRKTITAESPKKCPMPRSERHASYEGQGAPTFRKSCLRSERTPWGDVSFSFPDETSRARCQHLGALQCWKGRFHGAGRDRAWENVALPKRADPACTLST